MLRRRRAGIAALLVGAPLALSALTGCGAGTGQLHVSLTGDAHATYKPGDLARLTVTVTNTGPGSVNGVTVHVALPVGFRYRSTQPFTAPGSTRIQPVDAGVNTRSPIWGLWDLGAPGTDGPGINSSVQVTFDVEVSGQPGNDPVGAYAVGDTAAGQVNASPVAVVVVPSANLGALLTVTPGTAKAGETVVYEVRIANSGTESAQVGVLVTLPPQLTFTSSVTPFSGNAARNGGTNPIKNSLEVYYDGFNLPANSGAGPGFVVIQFKATVIPGAETGTFPVDCTVTDVQGDIVSVHAVAPLTIQPGGIAASPPPTLAPLSAPTAPAA
ncbi:MAG: DUF11 domain-containing protein [Candidatus Dormibacteraeota bacterium]|nr:DUF11 domain-containing protein [Candidatus Dormibacteraeota bacterium]